MASCIISFFLAAAVGNSECTILQFTAHWCEPCKQMQPVIAQLVQEGWDVRAVDADHEPKLVQQFRVENLPTLVILSGGREVDRIVGVASLDQVKMRTDRVAARNATSRHPASNVRAIKSDRMLAPEHSESKTGPIIRGQSPGVRPTANMVANAARLAAGTLNQSPSASTAISLNPEQALARAATATVRIRVDEGNTTSYGSGTIIDTRGADALILTCGHLFRGIDETANLTVDLFAGTPQEINIAAELLDFTSEESDIGLMSIRLPVKIEPVHVMPMGETVQIGQPVFSMGCDHGADPTRRDTQITNINRYIGAANIEIAGAPSVGRSGGGLFDLQGRLVGVCNAADATDDEGIYAAGEVIFDQLQRLNLLHLAQPQSPRAENTGLQLANARAPQTPSGTAVIQPASLASADLASSAGDDSVPWPDEAQIAPANLAEIERPLPVSQRTPSAASRAAQIICIVRENGVDRVITIDDPSPELMQQLQQNRR